MIFIELWDKVHSLSKDDQELLRMVTYNQIEAAAKEEALYYLATIYLGDSEVLH